ncbi:uncharacterized protein E0L32_001068 [Thyridium curvatum]|uniref:Uncharacterized protein n=1 Tax=Thyridium curvatum TaxID=1093900 RepID=A0A507B3S0_9PEZI|nr:uncharacterized protein E0L32_001068 [Thyridium curvatum]TPX11250.1 hypothetical protein E0L32_001068 [Thyridium curvatum]
MAAAVISPPDTRGLVAPLLPSLPGAAASTQPAPAILPFLSPILRQRVQLLSAASTEPWIRLLSYDTAKAAKLAEIARSEALELHPVSGEVEVDWESDVDVQYKRLDQETLQALIVFHSLNLFFRLVYCVGDQEGGGDGWRVGEVGVPDQPSPFTSFGGKTSIVEAEDAFKAGQAKPAVSAVSAPVNGYHHNEALDEEDDDDDYWARYDATPARTPAVKRSPAPVSTHTTHTSAYQDKAAEDAYFSQYDSVQPAMDNHDPDEEVEHHEVTPPLGLARPSARAPAQGADEMEVNETQGGWTMAERPERSSSQHSRMSREDEERQAHIHHPRPASASSHSSNVSLAVAKLEESAEKQDQSDFGVKQHVSRSIKSLFMLSRASGIDRKEFERLVKTELDMLGMMED